MEPIILLPHRNKAAGSSEYPGGACPIMPAAAAVAKVSLPPRGGKAIISSTEPTWDSGAERVATAMPEEFDAYRKWLGIPPEDQPPHHYRLLGIAPFEDDPDVIQNA